jgi:hypothetical protein
MQSAQRDEEEPDLEAVEINAGPWYLRALRLDEWSSDTRYTWAICEATTGESLGEVTLNPATGAIDTRVPEGHTAAAVAAADSVRRFATAIVPGTRGIHSETVVGPSRPE